MSSHLVKHVVPATFVSAAVVLLTLGVSAAQAAPMVRGRGMANPTVSLGHGGTSIGIIIAGVGVLVLGLGAIAYAIVADRRPVTPAVASVEPLPLPANRTEPEQERKAA
jgi:hypothetical protein